MTTEDIRREEMNANATSQRAVSIYGQNEGMDDFPVLKAFQQYIDAEQEKARKRIITICVFFGVFLVVIIGIFVALLHGINMRNQALSDKLVEFAINEANRRPVTTQPTLVQPAPQNDAALKAVTDTLVSLQRQMQENKEVQKNEPDEVRKAKAQIEAEKKMIAEERERLHQIEIERQRRKLYPELYDTETGEYRGRYPKTKRVRTLTDDDIRDIIREAYPESESDETKPKKHSDNPKSAHDDNIKGEPPSLEETESSDDDEAIEYFKDDDYTIPVDVKGSPSKIHFTVPVG